MCATKADPSEVMHFIRLGWHRKVLTGMITCLVLALGFVLMRADDPVLITFNPDPTAVRPRKYPLMNPLRNREPESLSEGYLVRLARGDAGFIRRVHAGETAERFVQRETQYPVRSWRIGGRWDGAQGATVMYWVRRGGGYAGGEDLEEEVSFSFSRAPQWALTDFSAIY